MAASSESERVLCYGMDTIVWVYTQTPSPPPQNDELHGTAVAGVLSMTGEEIRPYSRANGFHDLFRQMRLPAPAFLGCSGLDQSARDKRLSHCGLLARSLPSSCALQVARFYFPRRDGSAEVLWRNCRRGARVDGQHGRDLICPAHHTPYGILAPRNESGCSPQSPGKILQNDR